MVARQRFKLPGQPHSYIVSLVCLPSLAGAQPQRSNSYYSTGLWCLSSLLLLLLTLLCLLLPLCVRLLGAGYSLSVGLLLFRCHLDLREPILFVITTDPSD